MTSRNANYKPKATVNQHQWPQDVPEMSVQVYRVCRSTDLLMAVSNTLRTATHVLKAYVEALRSTLTKLKMLPPPYDYRTRTRESET
jgi:hypothetical protein